MTGAQASFLEARAALEVGPRASTDKVVPAAEAVAMVRDGDHVAIGGTCYSRTPMALTYALLRAGRRDLSVSRPLSSYEVELLLASGTADRLVTSWVGIGLRWGLPLVLRHYVEQGLAVYEEWSHLGIGLRYKAGAMGVPFLPSYSMLGSDLASAAGLETVACPYTGEEVAAIPALNPDVALIHVHRADRQGNAQVDGYKHMDVDMARAARRVIVSAERIVPHEEIAADPSSTMLPHFAVDAVVEAGLGAYPAECYGLYEADFAHFDEYSLAVREGGAEAARRYLGRYVQGTGSFPEFVEAAAGDRVQSLRQGAGSLLPR